MVDSRQRILEHLKRTGEASVASLSHALSLTPVTIRHHLEALRTEGLVAPPSARRKKGPGRPEMIYRASPTADAFMPRNYGELCSCLLQALQSARSGVELEQLLEEIGADLGGSKGPGAGVSRAAFAERFLDQRGYFPSIEQEQGRITLKLANCPFLEVAVRSPALCHFDSALIGALFETDVELRSRIIDKQPTCTFHVANSHDAILDSVPAGKLTYGTKVDKL
jgi:predicted ArsR family transcriptional regulator